MLPLSLSFSGMLPKIPFRCDLLAIYAFAKWRMDGEYVKFG